MKKKYKKIILLNLIIISFFLSSCVTTSKSNEQDTSSSYIENPVTTKSSDKLKTEKKYKEIIKTKEYTNIEIKEELDFLTTTIKYPSFIKIPLLDTYITNLIESGWMSFKEVAEKSWNKTAELNSFSLPPYEYSVNYKVTNTKDIISIIFTIYSFEGGAHGHTTLKTINYDKKTDKYLTITEATNYSYDEIADLCRKDLYKRLIEEEKFEIDGETVQILDEMRESGTEPIAGNYEAFTINDNELTIYFEPCKVAPHYYGVQTVVLKLK